jgi:hypothetical protein
LSTHHRNSCFIIQKRRLPPRVYISTAYSTINHYTPLSNQHSNLPTLQQLLNTSALYQLPSSPTKQWPPSSTTSPTWHRKTSRLALAHHQHALCLQFLLNRWTLTTTPPHVCPFDMQLALAHLNIDIKSAFLSEHPLSTMGTIQPNTPTLDYRPAHRRLVCRHHAEHLQHPARSDPRRTQCLRPRTTPCHSPDITCELG